MGRRTLVGVRRSLARLAASSLAADARAAFRRDVEAISVVELDAATCETAASFAEVTVVRTLDAIHLAAAQRAGGTALPFLTYDVGQAQAARLLGFTVLGS